MARSSLAPSFLVAMPQLGDPNFRRTVVLLVHHDEDGTFGLVVNREADLPAESLCESLGVDWVGDGESLVGQGGPVQPNTGWVLFAEEDFADLDGVTALSEGLYCAGSLEALRAVGASPDTRARLFLGYAGWGAGQLEEELAQGAWLLAPCAPEVIFEVDPDEMWEQVLARLGIDPTTLVSTPGVH